MVHVSILLTAQESEVRSQKSEVRSQYEKKVYRQPSPFNADTWSNGEWSALQSFP